jgi:hypothetical protein
MGGFLVVATSWGWIFWLLGIAVCGPYTSPYLMANKLSLGWSRIYYFLFHRPGDLCTPIIFD